MGRPKETLHLSTPVRFARSQCSLVGYDFPVQRLLRSCYVVLSRMTVPSSTSDSPVSLPEGERSVSGRKALPSSVVLAAGLCWVIFSCVGAARRYSVGQCGQQSVLSCLMTQALQGHCNTAGNYVTQKIVLACGLL